MSWAAESKNIFKIDKPQDWWCRVSGLASAHTTLRIDVIRLQKEQAPHFSEIMYLEFRKVAYFSGWLTWANADFRRAIDEEKARLIRNVSLTRVDLSDDELIHSSEFGILTLFVADGGEGKQTQILANAARLLDKKNNTLLEVG
ncbi:MAG: hypothetical protein K8L97_15700 [Anaerolineae bacterium]|nr:hypothetical protein [Anaerolineae bacterium]